MTRICKAEKAMSTSTGRATKGLEEEKQLVVDVRGKMEPVEGCIERRGQGKAMGLENDLCHGTQHITEPGLC